MAQTDWITRLDSDDAMVSTRLEKQLSYAAANPGVNVIGTRVYVCNGSGTVHGLHIEPALPAEKKGYLPVNPFSHPSITARRDWMSANPYDEALLRAQDRELWLRAWTPGSYVKLETPLTFYQIDELTRPRKARQNLRVNRRLLRRYGPALVGRGSTAAWLARTYASEARALVACASDAYAARELRRKIEALPAPVLRAAQFELDSLSAVDAQNERGGNQ